MKNVPIIDAAIVYDCPYTLKSVIFIMRNALSVPEMQYNLIPPLLIREAEIEVNVVLKIHGRNSTIKDHSINLSESGVRIPLSLNKIFSYFLSRKPTTKELETNSGNVYAITPEGSKWNSHSRHYATNETLLKLVNVPVIHSPTTDAMHPLCNQETSNQSSTMTTIPTTNNINNNKTKQITNY